MLRCDPPVTGASGAAGTGRVGFGALAGSTPRIDVGTGVKGLPAHRDDPGQLDRCGICGRERASAVRKNHAPDEFVEPYRRLPAQHRLCPRRVAPGVLRFHRP